MKDAYVIHKGKVDFCSSAYCGIKNGIVIDNVAREWKDVTCKNCLKLKKLDNYKYKLKENKE